MLSEFEREYFHIPEIRSKKKSGFVESRREKNHSYESLVRHKKNLQFEYIYR
jgi:hypothetical protein